jgi:hypothetical protein
LSQIDLPAAALLAVIVIVVMGPMIWLLWRNLRAYFRSMIALRDRIDRSQRW